MDSGIPRQSFCSSCQREFPGHTSGVGQVYKAKAGGGLEGGIKELRGCEGYSATCFYFIGEC